MDRSKRKGGAAMAARKSIWKSCTLMAARIEKKLNVSGKSNEIAEGLPEHDLWMHHFHSFPKEPTSGPVETWRSLSKIGSRAMRSHLSRTDPYLYIYTYIRILYIYYTFNQLIN
jgi:hypothetical protein